MKSPAILLVLLSLLTLPVVAEDKLPRVIETFEVDGHQAFVYAAPERAKGKPWLWYAPPLKGVSIVPLEVVFRKPDGRGHEHRGVRSR
jgi:hypothetical protein